MNAEPTPWCLPMERDLLPYEAATAVDARSILLLAPHPDDEVFGCGGLWALAAAQGVATQVVVVSDGAVAGDAAVREAESRAAARALCGDAAVQALEFWRRPDRGVRPDEDLVQAIGQAVQRRSTHWLLAPSPYEVHPDHRAVCLAAIAAASRPQALEAGVRLVFYEVGQPMLPNRLFDITPVIDAKRRAMDCFVSQLALQRYDEHVLALNRYRSYTLGPQVRYAEGYHVVDAGAQATGLAGILAREHLALEARVRRRAWP